MVARAMKGNKAGLGVRVPWVGSRIALRAILPPLVG